MNVEETTKLMLIMKQNFDPDVKSVCDRAAKNYNYSSKILYVVTMTALQMLLTEGKIIIKREKR